MNTRLESFTIPVDDERISGTLLIPATAFPGVLFVHGWGGSQEQDLARARDVAALGCASLTFDLRGHDRTAERFQSVNRDQNLRDLIAAYDWFVSQRSVEPSAIAVVGISYGGYLASLLTALRPVRWLALRAPAIYKDTDWTRPKLALHADPELPAYRQRAIPWNENKALTACAAFRGDVLAVESECDDVIPHQVVENYVAACRNARSITSRVIAHADHSLSDKRWQHAYTQILVAWLTEMVFGARSDGASAQVDTRRPQGYAAGR
ncbi:MAG: alpha/beta fold hydrolase [Gammaproteobacteria bacterium]|nr:alpha/beta fold hydrolase [Gammaproteobacteria bacterium]